MDFSCCHMVIQATDIPSSREFYVDKLELPLLEGGEHFFAVRAGDVRFSFFRINAERPDVVEDRPEVCIVLRTEDVEKAREFILAKGVVLTQDIVEAPNFMRFLTVEDPDHNLVYIAQYLGDPLAAK